MSAGSILIGIVLLAALGGAVVYPWWRPARRQVAQASANPHEEYQALVAAIRDLDFDYQAGVVTEADYQPLRNDLAAQAVSLLQALDHGHSREAELEEQIEILRPFDGAQGRLRSGQAAVSALRATRRPVDAARPDGAGASTCSECGHLVQAGNRFCAHCGAKRALSRLNCDGAVEPEDRFCGTCGQMLVEAVSRAGRGEVSAA